MPGKRLYGCHVSASGGLENAAKLASQLGINAIQIHPSAPQRWNTKPFESGVEQKFVDLYGSSGLERVFFHAIYLINLASPNPQQLHLSKQSLLHYLELCSRMNAHGVIVHVGSLKDEPSESAGFERAAQAISWILERAPQDSRLLLEVAAGSGRIIGDKLQELRAIYDQVEEKERLGFALDTQHMWASGYDLKTHTNQVVSEVESVFGINKVWAIHLNDSKTELGSHKDRHEDLGAGLIGIEALGRFVNHKKLQTIPFILETPALKTPEGAASEVKKLRALVGA